MLQRALAVLRPLMLAAVMLGAPTANAQQVPWRVIETQGVVRIAQPGQTPAEARADTVLATGSVITTGAGARIVIARGEQRMTMGPNSRVVVAPEAADGMTRILQDLGSVLFQVDRRGSPHFRVETPLLAAVVKGTTFTVTSDATQDAVHVSQGLVEVRALQGGQTSDVAAGATARVMRDSAGALRLAVPSASPSDLRDTTQAPALDYTTVSEGLVDGPALPGAAQAAPAQAAPRNANANQGLRTGNVSMESFAASGTTASPAAASVAIAAQAAQASANGNNGNGNGGNGNNGNGNGNGGNSGNGNNGNGNGNGGNGGNGNNGSGNGNGGNGGNGNNGNGNGNGGNSGSGNNGNGNGNGGNSGSGNNGNGNGNGGNSGSGNNGNGNGNGGNGGNGNNGNGNGNQGDDD